MFDFIFLAFPSFLEVIRLLALLKFKFNLYTMLSPNDDYVRTDIPQCSIDVDKRVDATALRIVERFARKSDIERADTAIDAIDEELACTDRRENCSLIH